MIFIGVARISSGVHLFPQKVDDIFVVFVLNTKANTAKLTTPTLQPSPLSHITSGPVLKSNDQRTWSQSPPLCSYH